MWILSSYLNFIWANFQQDFFSRKKADFLWRIAAKISKFQTKLDFFPIGKIGIQNFPNLNKFILLELHLTKFWAKSENLFWSVGREGGREGGPLPLASLAAVRGRASQLGAPGFSTERARLVVQVKRLRCTQLRHRTCKTSGSSKIAFLRRFPAHQGTSLRSCFQKSACYFCGFRFFFLKIPRIFKLEVGFFSAISFFRSFPKYRHIYSI